jgi:hypothetical protein
VVGGEYGTGIAGPVFCAAATVALASLRDSETVVLSLEMMW